MKHRIAIAAGLALATLALAACPREETPPREVEPVPAPMPPATPASLAPPASTATPQADEPKLPQNGHIRAPPPEPDPLIPPPPVDK